MLYLIDIILCLLLVSAFGLRHNVGTTMKRPYDLASTGLASLFGAGILFTLAWTTNAPHLGFALNAFLVLGVVSFTAAAMWAAAKSAKRSRNIILVTATIIICFGYFGYRHFSDQAAYNQELHQFQSQCVRACN